MAWLNNFSGVHTLKVTSAKILNLLIRSRQADIIYQISHVSLVTLVLLK